MNNKKDGLSGSVSNVGESLKIAQCIDFVYGIYYDIDRDYNRRFTIHNNRLNKSKRTLFELKNALENFDGYVYKDFPECAAVRLGIPHKISDCKNLNDEFKEDYYHMMRKKINNTHEFDGDILNTILHFRKNRPYLLNHEVYHGYRKFN